MNSTKVFAILALLSLAVIPALGAMTDYQQGVYAGLKAGMMIGKLLGASPYDPSKAQEFNAHVDAFNQGLAGAFGNNQTAISTFWLTAYSGIAAAKTAINTKPVHSIDGSWNKSTTTVLGDQDEGSRIYGLPASAYYTWVGPSDTTASNIPSLGYTGGNNNLGGA
jgi:hypothetical protein